MGVGRKKSTKRERTLKNYFVLYVEGETEKEYLEHMEIRKKYTNITLKIKFGNEDQFIENCADEIDALVILDIDGVTQTNDPKKRYDKIKKVFESEHKKRVFYNNYSFETFLLYHVTNNVKRILKARDYNDYMKAFFDIRNSWNDHKNQANRKKVFSKINGKTHEIAMNKLKQLKKNPFVNPTSNMDEFYNFLKKVQSGNLSR